MASTPPPPKPTGFQIAPIPANHLRAQRHHRLSDSFGLGPEALVDHLMMGGAGGTDDEHSFSANNSSILPVSPRLFSDHPYSRKKKDFHSRRKNSNLSISSSNPNNSNLLAAPSPYGQGSPSEGGPVRRTTTPLHSRLRHGGGPADETAFSMPGDRGEGTPVTALDELVDTDEDEGEPREGWEKMVEKMRTWRHDAMMQHLYETAAFWGDKVLCWTGDRNDAFWLAQIHFLSTQYSRALRILIHPLRPPNPPSGDPPGSSGGASAKGKERARTYEDDEDEIEIELGVDEQERREREIITGEGGIVGEELWEEDGGAGGKKGKRLVDLSLACRYLAAQCQVKMGLWQDGLEMLGPSNPFQGTAHSGPTIKSDGGFKLESSMCLLRGQIHLRLSSATQAKESFLEALSLDVRCYDAFSALVGGEMMNVEEEWDTIQSLCYREQTDECAEFIRMMYTVRLKKYKHLREITVTRRRLEAEYALADNADVLFGLADTLYAQYKWNECYAVTSRILTIVPNHKATLPLHLSCMHHLPRLRSALFLLAHELADTDPNDATSWYAVGLWYFTGERWGEARRYFGKASLMDPRFGPAWIAFAHSFALEKEHDQAIIAYSTSTRLFQGSHLPLLFIGMEHLQLQNISVAGDHFASAASICQTDPLLWNEMGVVAYTNRDFPGAIAQFQKALDAASEMEGTPATWAPTHLNLAYALRHVKRYDEALASYERCLQLDPTCDSAYAGIGMIKQLQGDTHAAIESYHEAFSLNPHSSQVSALLTMSLNASIDLGGALHSIKGLPPVLASDSFDPYRVDVHGGLLPTPNSSQIAHRERSRTATGEESRMEEDDEERDMSISQAGGSRIERSRDEDGGDEEDGEEEEETMDVEGDSMMI